MKISVYGQSHLAQALAQAADMRGMEVVTSWQDVDLIFAAEDILDHADLSSAKELFDQARSRCLYCPLILVSQVPPGTTRAWAGVDAPRVFYQVDTIIMRNALQRAYAPKQIIVGCADPDAALPLAYQEYLLVHDCPVLQMTYESAEMAKCAINYMLVKQIEAANDLAAACRKVGANYVSVEAALRNDARIGPHAYLRPGSLNQHLLRDVNTIENYLPEVEFK